MSFSLTEILKWTKGEMLASKGTKNSFKAISIDSRSIKKGDFFIAIKGRRFDGHNFLKEAFSKGIRGAIISTIPDDLKANDFVLIKVRDTLKALQMISAGYRKKFNLQIIAVTGSNGKTTTKDLIAHILQSKFSVLKSEGNFNNFIGMPLSLLNIKDGHNAAVFELGMSALGEIKLLAELAQPRFAVITNVGPAHLQFLGTISNAAKGKQELLESLDKEGTAFLNTDDFYLREMKKKFKGEVITFGIEKKADFQAKDIHNDNFFESSFKLNGKIDIFFPLLGRHNIYNVLAACAVSRRLGLDWEVIKYALANFSPASMRMQFRQTKGLNIINDAYNANPHSMKAAITSLLNLSCPGRKILVLGDMLELGDYSLTAHRRLGREAGKSGIDYLLTVGDFSRLTALTAVRFGMSSKCVFHSVSVKEAKPVLKNLVQKGDTILIKGSRALQLERILKGINNAL